MNFASLFKYRPLGTMVSQLELSDPEARAGFQKILDEQVREKKERLKKVAEENRLIQERIRQQAEIHQAEKQLNDLTKKELQLDYRNFLDHQKWGNATLKEQLREEYLQNPNPRRNGAHALLPPKPMIMPQQYQQQYAMQQQQQQQQQMMQLQQQQQAMAQGPPPYGVDMKQMMPVSRNIAQMPGYSFQKGGNSYGPPLQQPFQTIQPMM